MTVRQRFWGLIGIFCVSILFSPAAFAVADKDNQGRWTKPTNDGPDKEVPGFLVNLGPTGARAVLTEKTFVVRYIFKDSPATNLLKLDDEIVGVFGKPFSPHHFKGYGYEGLLMEFGEAIEKAEGKKDGKLLLNVTRSGKPLEITIALEPLGTFAPSFPFNCKKSELIRTRALKYFMDHPEHRGGQSHAREAVILALLSSDEAKIQAVGKEMALKWAGEMASAGTWTWHLSFQAIALSEYHLMSRDNSVLPAIKNAAKLLEKAQYSGRIKVWGPGKDGKTSDYEKVDTNQQLYDGGFGHDFYKPILSPPSGGFGPNGYGPMQYTTIFAVTAWQLAGRCGIDVDQDCIKRAMGFIHRGTNDAGYVAYGGEFTLNNGYVDPVAWKKSTGGENYVGRTGAAFIAHKLSPEFQDSGEYMAKYRKYFVQGHKSLADGHAEPNLGILWGLMGAGASEDDTAMRTMFDYYKAFFNMMRCHDGSFVLQPGRDYADNGYYISSRTHPTATMILFYGLNNPKLMIQGIQVIIPGINTKALKGKLDLAYKAIVAKAFGEAGRHVKSARNDKKISETDIAACDALSEYIEARLLHELANLEALEKRRDFLALSAAVTKMKPTFSSLDSYKEKIKPFEDNLRKDPWKTEVTLGGRYTKLMTSLFATKKIFWANELEKFAEKNPDSLYGSWAGEAAKAFKTDGSLIDPSNAKPVVGTTPGANAP